MREGKKRNQEREWNSARCDVLTMVTTKMICQNDHAVERTVKMTSNLLKVVKSHSKKGEIQAAFSLSVPL